MAFTTSSGESPFDLQRLRVQIHLNLALLAAVGIGNRDARHRDQPDADEIDAQVAQLLLGETLSGKSQLQDRHRRSVVLNNEGGVRPRRQCRTNGSLGDSGHLRDGGGNLDARMKKDFHDRPSRCSD